MDQRPESSGRFQGLFKTAGGLLELFKKIPGWIAAASGAVGTVVGFAKLIRGETELIFNIFLWGGPLLLWASCFYIYHLKKKKKLSPGFGPPAPQETYAFLPGARRAAYRGMFIVPALLLVCGAVALYFKYKPSDKVIVSVAEFKNLDSANVGTFEEIMARLREATKNYQAQIKVTHLGMVISDQDGGSESARKAGERKKASIIIWGWSSKDFITAYFEVLLKRRGHLAPSGLGPALNFELGAEKPFKVQVKQLSEGMAYLTLLTIGLAQYEAQDFDGAVRLLSDAVSHGKALTSADDELNKNLNLAGGYFYLGRALADQGSYGLAIANFHEAVKLNPSYEAAYLHLAYAQFFDGDKKGAAESFGRAAALYSDIIRNDPKNLGAYLNRGLAYVNLGDPNRALADFETALQIEPQSSHAYNNRGLIRYTQRKLDDAIADYTKAIQLDPYNAGAYNNRATAYSQNKEFDKALADYGKVIEYRRNDSVSYLSRGFVYFDKRDYEKAIADYDEAIRLNPGNYRAYRNRGWAHMFMGRYDDAAHDAVKFLELQRQCSDNFLYLTILGYYGYRKSNQPAAAEKLLGGVTAECESLGWTYSLIKFVRGQVNAQQLLEEAGPDKGRLTEAHTYIGMSLSLAGESGEAANHFNWVEANGDHGYDEYHLVLAEKGRSKLPAAAN